MLPLVTKVFQFMHLRGVRQVESKARATYINVSIHAPTRGCDVDDIIQSPVVKGFNSRTYEGCDRGMCRRDW